MAATIDLIIERLKNAGIPSPRLEARLLMEAAANAQVLEQMIQERLQHKPLDKILQHREFYKYDFKVSTDVLSPRPDTETLVEAATDIIRQQNINSVLELGIGSGCILLSLLADFKNLHGHGVDISPAALEIASFNARVLQVEDRCYLQQADWFDAGFAKLMPFKFNMLVSNPPYIPSKDIAGLDPEVKNFDPLVALDGGEDGLDCYRRIAQLAPLLLADEGYILLEVGINQAAAVEALLAAEGLKHLHTLKDLGGIERCIIFQKKDCNC